MDEAVTPAPVAPEVATPATNGDAPQSVLDRLRARRLEVQAEKHLDIEVPGYDDLLLIRYVPPSADAYARLSMLVTVGVEAAGDAPYIKALLGATRDVLVRDSVDAPTRPIDPEQGPRGFDARLSELLDAPGADAEAVLRAIFGSGASIGQHAVTLFWWANGVTGEVEAQLAGESSGRSS